MSKIKACILRAPGTNCDIETAFAFKKAGANSSLRHVNRFIKGEDRLSNYQILAIPGGFTYGDDISAGKVLANELRLKLYDDITEFIKAGGLIIGICNGFQVLVKAGVLPPIDSIDKESITLTTNDSGKFECRWVHLRINPESSCIFTKNIESLYLPSAHAEGKLISNQDILKPTNIALYYTDENNSVSPDYPNNPNGSELSIAGINDDSGRVFALMPHPERYINPFQHPRWTRSANRTNGDGFHIFSNAVNWIDSQ
jgi:phosphoribosylformylglycinamidine synthase